VIRLLGNLLVVVGLGGFALVIAAPRLPTPLVEPVAAAIDPIVAVVLGEVPPSSVPINTVAVSSALIGHAGHTAQTAITRLVIPSINLDTAVVPAALVEHAGVATWDVPKFVAGHAEGSAGAGEPGNAVVIGHVTSLTLGHVFDGLDKVSSGDAVQVFSSEQQFTYRVTEVRDVARADVGVLEPTSSPSLTLITCTGAWLPWLHDYAQRLIIQATLS
jgi:LPXTG-site transpeptidase (sortase) family protein